MEHSFWYNYYYKDLQNTQNLAKEIKEKSENLNGFFKELNALKKKYNFNTTRDSIKDSKKRYKQAEKGVLQDFSVLCVGSLRATGEYRERIRKLLSDNDVLISYEHGGLGFLSTTIVQAKEDDYETDGECLALSDGNGGSVFFKRETMFDSNFVFSLESLVVEAQKKGCWNEFYD